MKNRVKNDVFNKIRKTGNLVNLMGVAAIVTLSGCYQPEPRPVIVETEPFMQIETQVGNWVAGRSVQGQPILVETLGNGPETVLLMASIHGNEAAGTPLLRVLNRYLQDNPSWLSGRQIILINIANPDGWRSQTRGNANGVDLNRNFTTTNRINNSTNGNHGLSEPEAVILKNVILRYRPNRIISLHQPLECIDYDGPGLALAQRMAAECSLPVKKLGARPGSLGSYAGETLGIPIITFEMKASDSQLNGQQLWNHYGRALLAGIEG